MDAGFFNMGLINYIEGSRRMLPCQAGEMNFFVEPYGDIYPCNGLEKKYWKRVWGIFVRLPISKKYGKGNKQNKYANGTPLP